MSDSGEPSEPLSKNLILDGMAPSRREILTNLSIEPSLDSTNSALQRLPVAQQHGRLILAEQQTSGRGRRVRGWHSPFGKNLYLSLGWKFEKQLSELGCLPLVVALSTARALTRAGLNGHRIKWPNDILLDGRKLCGCLVEMQTGAQGACHAVLGIGINVHMPALEADAEIDQPWTDLHSQLPNCSRNTLAALLVEELFDHLLVFSGQGFEPLRTSWQLMDGLEGQMIEVFAGKHQYRGVSLGIDANGALLLDTGEQVMSLHSAEVSLNKSKPGLSIEQ
jgi:BirA family biotin operon repressor/biotin-[acetyl-CoA-carboxylase] ligase